MTLLWIIGSVAVLAIVVWRLRTASGLVDRILVEERAGAERDARREAERDTATPAVPAQATAQVTQWPHPPRHALSRRRAGTHDHRLAG
ncbi:hypothetical protein V5P93_006344 [Actinokineospora auranticolor]|uniref:Uncharacterized protein n=1 Tax=Actinokineospora auranticolor TaxID=155976 RepID=A0A2S6GFU9_9PSEU|nr:hypothetical protein [Actinokineospora auranticolor]PPK64092.1 hypothetical protein CLV40_12283 [Actinokineospora auranticolor]